jgi:LPXTG-motif cell wall-anchored protein
MRRRLADLASVVETAPDHLAAAVAAALDVPEVLEEPRTGATRAAVAAAAGAAIVAGAAVLLSRRFIKAA